MADNIHEIVVRADTGKAISELKKLSEVMNEQSKSVSKASASFTSLNNSFNSIGATLAGAGIVGGIVAIGRSSLMAAGQMEQIAVSFEVFTGSAEVANKTLTALKEQALRSPMQFQDITKGAQTLLGYGITAEQVIPITKMLGDISGGNADKFSRLALAFGQVNAAGRLMGQEARQMINAGFNPLQAISEKTGESMASLTKRMKNGQISVKEVGDAFTYATSQGGRFYLNAEKQSQTFIGQLNKLKESVTFILAEIGNSTSKDLGIGAGLEKLGAFLTELKDRFIAISPETKEFSLKLVAVGLAMTPLIMGISRLISMIITLRTNLVLLSISGGGIAKLLITLAGSFLAAKAAGAIYSDVMEDAIKKDPGLLKEKNDELREQIKNYDKLIKQAPKVGFAEVDPSGAAEYVKSKSELMAERFKLYKQYAENSLLLKKFESATKSSDVLSGLSDKPTGADKQMKETNSIYAKGWNKIRDTIYGVDFVPKTLADDFKRLYNINREAGNSISRFWDSNTAERLLKLDANYKEQIQKFKDFNAKNKGGEIEYTNVTKQYLAEREKILKDSDDRLENARNKGRGRIFDNKKIEEGIKEVEALKKLGKEYEAALASIANTNSRTAVQDQAMAVYSSMRDLNVSLMAGTAELLGTAIAAGTSIADVFKQFGAMILDSLGNALVQMGTAAIAAGTVGTILKAFFSGGVATVPELGIAGGMAAVAVGSAMKALSGKLKEANNASTLQAASNKGTSAANSKISGMTSGSSYQYGGSSYATQSIKLSIDLTGAITASPTGYNINKSLETVLRVTGR